MAAHMMPPAMFPIRIFQTALSDQRAFLTKATRTYRLAPHRLRPGMAYSLSKTFVRWFAHPKPTGSGALARRSALRRSGTAEEVAEVLASCASDQASYLTGIDVLCDGGSLARASLRDKVAMARQT
jgi:NAD(P)-dependent dehydrogenase (short-subunit alcohol dehydrogenase family)